MCIRDRGEMVRRVGTDEMLDALLAEVLKMAASEEQK